MYKSVLLKIVFIVSLLINVSACESKQQWNGQYKFVADFGENAAETPILVSYDLIIKDDKCALAIVGYQVADDLVCDVRSNNDNKIDVLFKSYADGSLMSFYPVQMYQVGEVLFSLTIENKKLTTSWGTLIDESPFAKEGEFFIKQ